MNTKSNIAIMGRHIVQYMGTNEIMSSRRFCEKGGRKGGRGRGRGRGERGLLAVEVAVYED